MESFAQSTSGRLMMAAHAAFLASAAVYLFNGNLYVWGIGLPAGLTIAFVSVGFGMNDYLKETMIGITLMPALLWGFMYLMGELDWRGISWPAYVMGVAALYAAFRAAVPPGSAAKV